MNWIKIFGFCGLFLIFGTPILFLVWLVFIVIAYMAKRKAGTSYAEDANYLKFKNIRRVIGWSVIICIALFGLWLKMAHDMYEKNEKERQRIAQSQRHDDSTEDLAEKEKDPQRYLDRQKYKKYIKAELDYKYAMPGVLQDYYIPGLFHVETVNDTICVSCSAHMSEEYYNLVCPFNNGTAFSDADVPLNGAYDIDMAYQQTYQICEALKKKNINKKYGQYLKYCNIEFINKEGGTFAQIAYKLDDIDKYYEHVDKLLSPFVLFGKARFATVDERKFKAAVSAQLTKEEQISLKPFLQVCKNTKQNGGMREPQAYRVKTQIDDRKNIKQYLEKMLKDYKILRIDVDLEPFKFDYYSVNLGILTDTRSDEERRLIGEKILKKFIKYPPRKVKIVEYTIGIESKVRKNEIKVNYAPGEESYGCYFGNETVREYPF